MSLTCKVEKLKDRTTHFDTVMELRYPGSVATFLTQYTCRIYDVFGLVSLCKTSDLFELDQLYL